MVARIENAWSGCGRGTESEKLAVKTARSGRAVSAMRTERTLSSSLSSATAPSASATANSSSSPCTPAVETGSVAEKTAPAASAGTAASPRGSSLVALPARSTRREATAACGPTFCTVTDTCTVEPAVAVGGVAASAVTTRLGR